MTAFIGAIFGSTPASLPRPALVRALALRPVKHCRLRDGAVGDYVAMPEPMDLSTGMALVADAVDEVAAAAQPIVLTATPLDQSPGIGEISREARYRPEPDATPVTNTYAYACLLGYGAVDALRAVSILLRATSLPVWAPLVNARAGVESAAQMYWLIEPGVSVEARVQRGMAFRLHNARQQRMAPAEVTAARERARAAIADVRSQAQRLGWSISGRDSKQARVDAEVQPTSKSAIAAVLRCRESTKESEAGVRGFR